MIDIKHRQDERGILASIEDLNLPFSIKRVFWIAGIDPKLKRGSHAHYKTRQCLICIQGNCNVYLDDGKETEDVALEAKGPGLILEPHMWHYVHKFSEDCIFLVLASQKYDEKDYIRNYEKFKEVYKR